MSECITTDLATCDAIATGSYCVVLDRMADPSGAAYWIGQLAGSGQLTALWSGTAGSNEYFNKSQ